MPARPQRGASCILMRILRMYINCITSVKFNDNINTYTPASENHKEETTTFHHGDSAWTTTVKSEMDPTRDVGYYGDADLGEFLARPVAISSIDWTVTTGNIDVVMDPWTLFLENTRVRDRIEGYRLLQGKLNLRVAINGGPFFYGRAICGYLPRVNEQTFMTANASDPAFITQLSQLPHVFLDPTTSEGGSLVAPFFNPDTWIDLPGQTYKDMGSFRVTSINDLLHANSSTGKVSIIVYAWMTDVRLAAPTSYNFGAYDQQCGAETAIAAGTVGSIFTALMAWLAHCHMKCVYDGSATEGEPEEMEPQAGDEYGTGIISKPASVVAKVAGMLSNIPSIRPFARPTEMIAEAVGRAAHVFGYSRPAIISNIVKMKPKSVGHLASTDQHDAVVKLSLDSKQELCIDPRTVGLSDVDEMSIDYIKQREAYLCTFSWDESDVTGTELGELVVGPDHLNRSNSYNYLAPCYVVALPFQYWRGSIKYRFQFAASQMHRGRIKLTYDPCGDAISPDENQVYTRIVDLATNRDFEMVVSWNHSRPWLRVNNRLSSAVSSGHTAPGMVIYHGNDYHNGMLRVEVVNELTSPDPLLAQPVYLNVFVSGGDDLEFAAPSESVLQKLTYYPQSGYEPQSGTAGEEMVDNADNVPESAAPIEDIGIPVELEDKSQHIFFGETCKSIRSLLKRYCYHCYYGGTAATNPFTFKELNFPVHRGSPVPSRHLSTTTGYNYVGMTYLNYFTPCFAGWRGSLRSKYVTSDKTATNIGGRRLAAPLAASLSAAVTTYNFNGDHDAAFDMEAMAYNIAGGDLVYPDVDGALEMEFPFYCYRRFAPARVGIGEGTTVPETYWGNDFGHLVYCMTPLTRITRYVAAGDDFSLFFWIGMPGIQQQSSPTPFT